MTRNQMDVLVAAKVGCTAAYVMKVRLNPSRFKSERAQEILFELQRIRAIYENAKREALQAA